MNNIEIDFWSLVEYDYAARLLDNARNKIRPILRKAVSDIASVILSLNGKNTEGFRFISDGTLDDLKKIASPTPPFSTEYCLDCLQSVLDDQNAASTVFLASVRESCPASYEFYVLARHCLVD